MGSPNGTASNGVRTGAWGREGSPAQLFGGNQAAPGGPNNAGNPPAGMNARRFDEADSFERPPPKSFGLYNPTTGTGPAALPVQVRNPQEGSNGASAGPQQQGAGDALADQVSKLSVAEGGKVAGGA